MDTKEKMALEAWNLLKRIAEKAAGLELPSSLETCETCMWWDYNVNGIGYCRETNSKIHASFSDCPACSRYINNKTEVHSTCER